MKLKSLALITIISLFTLTTRVIAAPAAPTLTVSGTQISASWQAYPEATSYHLSVTDCINCGPSGELVYDTASLSQLIDEVPSDVPEVYVTISTYDSAAQFLAGYPSVSIANPNSKNLTIPESTPDPILEPESYPDTAIFEEPEYEGDMDNNYDSYGYIPEISQQIYPSNLYSGSSSATSLISTRILLSSSIILGLVGAFLVFTGLNLIGFLIIVIALRWPRVYFINTLKAILAVICITVLTFVVFVLRFTL